MPDSSKPTGRRPLPLERRRREIFRFRANDNEIARIRRLAAHRSEDDSKVLRAAVKALEREHDPAHGGALRELLALLRARDPAAALERLRALLGRAQAPAARI